MSNHKLITAFLILCVTGMPFFSMAQVRPITGTVLDGKNHPIVGASILIQGKSQGTVSDEAGKFKLSVPDNASLIVSFTGYRTQIVRMTSSSDIKIDMVEDVARLDEIVVTGGVIWIQKVQHGLSQSDLSFGLARNGSNQPVKVGNRIDSIRGF